MIAYFVNAKEGDEVFGLIFGHGKITTAWGTDSYYTFEVTYDNGHVVPYTDDGYPAWSNGYFQTVFYKNEVDQLEIDTTNVGEDVLLTPTDIIKLRLDNKLEIKCPSLVWQNINECPGYIAEEYLLNKKFNFFRIKK